MTLKVNNFCEIEGCNNQAEIKNLCKTHYWSELKKKSKTLKKTALKKKKYQLKKQAKLKAVSERGKKRNELYRKARKEYLLTHQCCEAKLQGCTIPTVNDKLSEITIHHKKGKVGDLLFDQRYFIAVCMNCHMFIEANNEWSKLNGYSVDRLKKEE